VAKKVIGYVVAGLIVIAVLVLVYVFITKGYSVGNVATTLMTGTANPAGSTSQQVGTSGTVASTKISLVVTSPLDGSTLSSTNVTVKGKTSPNADVFVDDQSGKADASGNFAISIGLDEGQNQIVVSANDSVGNAAEEDLNVTVTSFQ
jgi:Flp pilus assembly protein TadG